MQDAVRLALPRPVSPPIETLKQKPCVLNMERSLQTLVVDASVKNFSAPMKPRGSLPYNAPGPYSQSISIAHTTYFLKLNFNINTHP